MHFKGLGGLQFLRLSQTRIADAGLVHLKGLTFLLDLSLYDRQVTWSCLLLNVSQND